MWAEIAHLSGPEGLTILLTPTTWRRRTAWPTSGRSRLVRRGGGHSGQTPAGGGSPGWEGSPGAGGASAQIHSPLRPGA